MFLVYKILTERQKRVLFSYAYIYLSNVCKNLVTFRLSRHKKAREGRGVL